MNELLKYFKMRISVLNSIEILLVEAKEIV